MMQISIPPAFPAFCSKSPEQIFHRDASGVAAAAAAENSPMEESDP
jgi:hypothetical protein